MNANIRLGKKAPRIDRRTLQFSKYRLHPSPTIPPAPAEASWCVDVPSWPMFLNDQLGDCVVAGMGHMEQQWSFFVKEKLGQGTAIMMTDAQIEKGYEDIGGYIPGNPDTDNGCDMLTALRYWRRNGLAGRKILAYVQVDPKNDKEVQEAISMFGNLYTGIALPNSAQSQSAWTVPDGGPVGDGSPGSWGGHCVPIMAYSPKSLTCITWGQRLKMSWNFFRAYCDEAYAVLSPDWLDSNKNAPSNFNLTQLQADLAAL